jgi:hypothetical protein
MTPSGNLARGRSPSVDAESVPSDQWKKIIMRRGYVRADPSCAMHTRCTNASYRTEQLTPKCPQDTALSHYAADSCAITWHQWQDE